MKTTTKLSFLASSFLGAMLLTLACSSSSSDNATPTNATGGSTSTPDATGGADNGGSTSTSDTGGSGDTGGATSSDTGGAGGAMSTGTGGSTATVCTLDTTKKCYPACQPINNIQFLNQCTNAACQGFDNTARGVPSPLPNVP